MTTCGIMVIVSLAVIIVAFLLIFLVYYYQTPATVENKIIIETKTPIEFNLTTDPYFDKYKEIAGVEMNKKVYKLGLSNKINWEAYIGIINVNYDNSSNENINLESIKQIPNWQSSKIYIYSLPSNNFYKSLDPNQKTSEDLFHGSYMILAFI